MSKVVVALWSVREPLPDPDLPTRLNREDDVLEVGRQIDLPALIGMAADDRARALHDIHHEAIRAACTRYGWDGDAVDAAREAAEAGGVIARRRLEPVAHAGGTWAVGAEGWVDERGLHVTVRAVDPVAGAVLKEVTSDMPGGWH